MAGLPPTLANRKALRSAIRARGTRIGAFCSIASPDVAEMIAYTGYDFIVVDAEHGVMTPVDIAEMIRAGQGAGCPVLVRVPHGDAGLVGRAIDAGADGIVFPHVESAREAREAAGLLRHPPQGSRGLAFHSRSFRYALDKTADDIARAEDDLICAVMIESARGVERSEEIRQVPEVDFVLVGPNDLRVYVGFDEAGADFVSQSIRRLGRRAADLGVAIAVSAPTPAAAAAQLEAGYTVVVCNIVPMLVERLGQFRQGIPGGDGNDER